MPTQLDEYWSTNGENSRLIKDFDFVLVQSMVLFFRRLWTNVHQIKQACRGVFADCNAVFRLMITCSNPEIFAITL